MATHGNTFMGGMDKDTSKQKYANNKYYDAKNLRPVTDKGLSTGALENIKGTEELFQMKELSGMVILTSTGLTLEQQVAGGSPHSDRYNPFKIILDATGAGSTAGKIELDGGPSVLNSGIGFSPSITTLDKIFDAIESELIDRDISYERLKDEDRILIYNPDSLITGVTITQGVAGPFAVEGEILPEVSNFVVIGHTPLREKTILFTVNEKGDEVLSQIWSIYYDPKDPKDSAEVTLLYNGRLDFSKNHPIEALARYENSEIQRVYFTDNFNIPRTFNAARTDIKTLRVKDFSLIVENEIVPPLVTTEDQDGGTLPTGLWYTTYRLKKFGGATTPIAPFSGATAVTTSKVDLTTNDPKYWDYAYATTIVNSTKILNYTISFLPVGFDEITIYAVNETAPGQFKAFLIKTATLTSESSYEFSLSTITDLEEVPIEDLKQYDVDFERVKTITAKYNRLLFGNVKEAAFNIEFDARVYRFKKTSYQTYDESGSEVYIFPPGSGGTLPPSDPKTWDIGEGEDRINPVNKDKTAIGNYFLYKRGEDILGGTGPNIEYEFTFKEITLDNSSNAEPSSTVEHMGNDGNAFWPEETPYVNMPATEDIEVTVNDSTINIGAGFTNFKNGRMESYFKGYMRDEVYRFGLVFYSKTGRSSDVKWIGDIRMPCAGDFGKVDEKWEGAIAQWYTKTIDPINNDAVIPKSHGETKGWVLGIKFIVNLTNYPTLKQDISGFSIVRAPRKQKDKTIIAEGALGEVAGKNMFSKTAGTDYLFGREFTPASENKASIDPSKLGNSGKRSDNLLSTQTPGNSSGTIPPFSVGTFYPSGSSLPYNYSDFDPGDHFNEGGTPAPGFYYKVPFKGTFTFKISLRIRLGAWLWRWNEGCISDGGDLDFADSYALLGFNRTRDGNTDKWIKTSVSTDNPITVGDLGEERELELPCTYYIPEVAIDNVKKGLNTFTFTATIDCKENDLISATGKLTYHIYFDTNVNLGPNDFHRILLQTKIEPGSADASSSFECKGPSINEYNNQRLFNLTRIIDGNADIDPDTGKPNVFGVHTYSVKDDWTIYDGGHFSNESFGASDSFKNIGRFKPQYATLDCPDLKFATGTKVSSYFEEDDEESKYTIKPVAGYVHISEDNPITNTATFAGDVQYTENSAVRSLGFSELGTIETKDFPSGTSGETPFMSYFSRYSKSLALCHGVSFNDRLNFSYGPSENSNTSNAALSGFGKIKELKKVENGGYSDIETTDSLDVNNPDADPNAPLDIKFLNAGFNTRQFDGFTLENVGSALISPGVFTVFVAGYNVNMTTYLLNYAFGYGDTTTRDKDPYLGIGLNQVDANTDKYFEQHNTYGGDGNKIGFYNVDGSTKIPRRGQVAIVDVCRELDKQYGGATFKERKNTEYISAGHFTRVTEKDDNVFVAEVFGGDIFQSAFAEKKLYATNFNHEIRGGTAGNLQAPTIAWSPIVGRIYPIQSVVNTDMRVGYHFNNFQNYLDPDDPGANTANEDYQFKRDDYLCPVLFSIEKKLQNYLVTGQNKLLGEFDNRVYMSQQKLNGELFDAWTIFKPLDYMDVDGHYGPINKLEVFNDQILFFQDKSFGLMSLNPQSLITDGSGGEVQLGTGKGLVTFRYISNAVGAFHQWGIVKGKAAMYFFDAYHRKFFRYSSKGPEPLSDLKGMSSWFFNKIDGNVLTRDNPILYNGITSVYDQRFSEAIFTFHLESIGVVVGGSTANFFGHTERPCLIATGYFVNGVFWFDDYSDFLQMQAEINNGAIFDLDFANVVPAQIEIYPNGFPFSGKASSTVGDGGFIDQNNGGMSIDVSVSGIISGSTGQLNNMSINVYCVVDSSGDPIITTLKSKKSYTIAFNEMTDAFTSFYDHYPQHYISDSKRIFSQPPGKFPIYMHDEGVRGVFYGNTAKSIIELIVNPKGDWTKVFNNLEYVTQTSDAGGDLVDVTFDRLKVSNEYQDSGDITLVVDDNVKRRMRTWRTQVPRDGKARIRNPHMLLKFEYENNPTNRRIIIEDILTHYIDAPM